MIRGGIRITILRRRREEEARSAAEALEFDCWYQSARSAASLSGRLVANVASQSQMSQTLTAIALGETDDTDDDERGE